MPFSLFTFAFLGLFFCMFFKINALPLHKKQTQIVLAQIDVFLSFSQVFILIVLETTFSLANYFKHIMRYLQFHLKSSAIMIN